MKYEFKIDVDCANCAFKVEEAIASMKEIDSCYINFLTKKMVIECDEYNDKLEKKILKKAKHIEPDFKIYNEK